MMKNLVVGKDLQKKVSEEESRAGEDLPPLGTIWALQSSV